MPFQWNKALIKDCTWLSALKIWTLSGLVWSLTSCRCFGIANRAEGENGIELLSHLWAWQHYISFGHRPVVPQERSLAGRRGRSSLSLSLASCFWLRWAFGACAGFCTQQCCTVLYVLVILPSWEKALLQHNVNFQFQFQLNASESVKGQFYFSHKSMAEMKTKTKVCILIVVKYR